MGFATWLLYLGVLLVRPQELHPEWAGYSLVDALAVLAVCGTALSLLLGERPRLSWAHLAVGLGFLLWSSFSVAVEVRWLGGANARLLELSVPLFTFTLVALNVTTRRQLGITAGVICCSVLLLLGIVLSAYYSGASESPFFITTAARGALDTALDSPEIGTIEREDPDAGDELSDAPGTSEQPMVKRIQGPGIFSDPNDFAQALVAAIPLLFVAWSAQHRLRSLAIVVAPTALLVWGTLLTRSRGGLLSLLVLLPMAVLQRLSPRWRGPVLVATAVAAVPGVVVLFGYALADASAAGRIEAWSAGLQMLKASPVWGVGSGFFTEHHERVAHNSFVQCFGETGLVGYFFWLALVVLSLDQMSQLANTSERPEWVAWARAAQLSLLSFLFSSLFLSRTTSPQLFLLAGLTAAVASAARLDGEDVPLPVRWPFRVVGVEIVSILTVWLTLRAAR